MTDVLNSVAERAADDGVRVAAPPDISSRRILCVFPRYEASLAPSTMPMTIDGHPARLHAAAGPACYCRLPAAGLAGQFRRRERRSRTGRGLPLGRCGLRERHARSAPHINALPPRAPAGKSSVLGGPSVSSCPELLPAIRLSARRRDRRRHRKLFEMLGRTCGGRRRRCVLKTRIGSPTRPLSDPRLRARKFDYYFLGTSNSRAAARSPASSATFPGFTAGCRG